MTSFASRVLRFSSLAAALGCIGVAGCAAPDADDDARIDELASAVGVWDAAAEDAFSAWVGRIGAARAAGECTKLNACLNDASINDLKRDGDGALDLFADCADVPMELRAYFARKTGRPFKYVSDVAGDGPDERYASNLRPVRFATASGASSMQSLMTNIANTVHSGFYRMAPGVEDSDTYTIRPSAHSLRAGSVFYDPNGHVLIVWKVETDGTIWTMDGHPDNSLTFGRFLEGRYAVGGRSQGGGFRNFRPQRVRDGRVELVPNGELPDFGDNQYGHGDGFVGWVRTQIANGPGPSPEALVNGALDQICEDLGARVRAVADGAAMARGPLGPLPRNIYGADGDWEAYSTPGRDARLRASFRGVFRLLRDSVSAASGSAREALVSRHAQAWDAHVARASCRVTYENSAGSRVTLTLADVMDRIYELSFDPYHCPEMRWGAYPSNASELATCPTNDAAHRARFDAERQNRNVIDRPAVITSTGPDFGPDEAEDIDIPRLLRSLQ